LVRVLFPNMFFVTLWSGTNALHGIVKEILSKCFDDAAMSSEMADGLVESVAKNNFEWYYVSKPHLKLPHADFRPLDSTIQGKFLRAIIRHILPSN
jgi:hypothetical protein